MKAWIAYFALVLSSGANASDCGRSDDSSDPTNCNETSAPIGNERVRKKLESRALSGDSDAAMSLANFYLDGTGANDKNAIKWLRIYQRNSRTTPSILFAQLLLASGSLAGSSEGTTVLYGHATAGDFRAAELLADALVRQKKPAEAQAWYGAAAVHGSSNAMIKLGDLLLSQSDQPSRSLGVMWTLVAANEFQHGTFKNKLLMSKAVESAANFGLDYKVIAQFAKSIRIDP